jgi:hypothetical protein
MPSLRKRLASLSLAPLLLAASPAQATTAQDAIKAQKGCFKVTFQYEEVEAHQDDYVLAPPKTSSVIELVTIEEDSPTRIVLQHILVTPPRIKHWKQVWQFEQAEFDEYTGENQWTERTLNAAERSGQWAQVVRGVADNPRYGCSSQWSLGDTPAWSCQTWAAKPRRDKDRDDYNVLNRTNTHRIHAQGWVHEQRNTKIRVEANKVTPIVTEVGHNTYDRIDASECEEALGWWRERKTTWDAVQGAWHDVSSQHVSYKVTPKRGALPLWVRLFWIARRPLPEHKHPKLRARAKRIIERHTEPVTSPPGATQNTH